MDKKGFTLIEVIGVVIILASIVLIIWSNFLSFADILSHHFFSILSIILNNTKSGKPLIK